MISSSIFGRREIGLTFAVNHNLAPIGRPMSLSQLNAWPVVFDEEGLSHAADWIAMTTIRWQGHLDERKRDVWRQLHWNGDSSP
jgi:hypothetical protein